MIANLYGVERARRTAILLIVALRDPQRRATSNKIKTTNWFINKRNSIEKNNTNINEELYRNIN